MRLAAEALRNLDGDAAAQSAETVVLGRKLAQEFTSPAEMVKTMSRLEELIERESLKGHRSRSFPKRSGASLCRSDGAAGVRCHPPP